MKYTILSVYDKTDSTVSMLGMFWILVMYKEKENIMLQMIIMIRHIVDDVCNTLTDLFWNGLVDRSCTKNMQKIGRNVRLRYMGSITNVLTAAMRRFR